MYPDIIPEQLLHACIYVIRMHAKLEQSDEYYDPLFRLKLESHVNSRHTAVCINWIDISTHILNVLLEVKRPFYTFQSDPTS